MGWFGMGWGWIALGEGGGRSVVCQGPQSSRANHQHTCHFISERWVALGPQPAPLCLSVCPGEIACHVLMHW